MLKFQVLCLFAMVFVSGNHLSGVDGQFPRFGGFPGFGVPRFPPFGGPFRPLPGAFGGGFGSDFPAFRGPPIELRPPTGPPRGPPTGPADFDRIRAENGGLPVFGGAEANTGGVGGVFGQQSMSGGGGQFSDPVTGQPIQVVSSDMANAVRQARTGGDQRMAGTGRTFPLGQGQDFQQFGRTFGGQGVGPQGQMPVGPMGPVGPQGSADQFGRFGAQGGFVADQFGAQGQGQIGVPGGPAMMRPGGPMRIRIPADGSQPIVTRDGVSQPLPQGMTLSDLGISVPPSVNNNVNGGFVQGGSFRNDQRLIGQSGIVQSATSISAGQAAAGIDHSHSNANNLNNMNNMNNMNNNANVGVGTAGGGPDLVVLQIEDLRRDNLPAIMRALSNIAGAQPDPVQGTRGVI